MVQRISYLKFFPKQTFIDRISGIFTFECLIDSEPTFLVGTPNFAVAFRAAAD